MEKWKNLPQENEGTYFFSGRVYITLGVREKLTLFEITCIHQDVLKCVRENNGLDYLQVYEDDNENKLFFIDNITKEEVTSGRFLREDNYCTLMFAHEY